MKDMPVDMSNPREQNQILSFIRSLSGMYRVSITKFRPRRTDRQNRFYWPAVFQPFAEWVREMGNDWTDQQCHEHLKREFLTVTAYKHETGEVIGDAVLSTTKLDTVEFNEYVEKCIGYVSERTEQVIYYPSDKRA